MIYIIAIILASLAWFFISSILFFNPIVQKIYNKDNRHPSVKVLSVSIGTVLKIWIAILIQCTLWALVYYCINSALPDSTFREGLIFGGIIIFIKVIPRDIDRLLLSNYPKQRMTIEFLVGIICAFVVGFVFAFYL